MHVRRPLLTLLSLFFAAIAFAQQSVNFNHRTFTSSGSYLAVAVDLNNDRASDIVSNGTSQLPNDSKNIYVQLSNGDGTFQPPRAYPAGGDVIAIATADFDGDGNADVAALRTDSSDPSGQFRGVTIFYGNGDGTLQSPVSFSNPAIDAPSQLVVGDFNSDGKRDIMVRDCNAGAHLFLNAGGRAFTYGGAKPSGNVGCQDVNTMYSGDFDGDGHMDYVIEMVQFSPRGNGSIIHLQAFYGDGQGNFTAGPAFSETGYMALVSADLDSDGKSDLVGVFLPNDSTVPGSVIAYFGNAGRQWARTTLLTGFSDVLNVVTGDFNGDGTLDVAFSGKIGSSSGTFFALQNANKSFTLQKTGYPVNPQIVGDFNRDGKVDIAQIDQSTNTLQTLQNASSGGFNHYCPVAVRGIAICHPAPGSNNASPTYFKVSASDFTPVRKIEVWVDGAKLTEKFYSYFDYSFLTGSLPLVSGTHTATIIAAGYDNTLMTKTTTFTVGSTSACSAPSSPGVNMCSPVNGSSVTSPVHALAKGTVSGTVKKMELWVDGVRKVSVSGNIIDTHLTLGIKGTRRFDFYIYNTAGQRWQSTAFATVK